jgi:transcriptional regulator with XRE-family HTH domain
MNVIGTRIRKIREEQGLKQEYIAAEMGITQSDYGRLEKDDNRLTATKLIKISEILNVSVSTLFGDKAANDFYYSLNRLLFPLLVASIATPNGA